MLDDPERDHIPRHLREDRDDAIRFAAGLINAFTIVGIFLCFLAGGWILYTLVTGGG